MEWPLLIMEHWRMARAVELQTRRSRGGGDIERSINGKISLSLGSYCMSRVSQHSFFQGGFVFFCIA